MASIAKMSYDEESISLAILLAPKSMGYLELQPLQEQVVKHFVGGRDVFVSFPTGGDKSLCSAILPLVVPAFLVPGRLIPDSLADRFTGERARVEDADIGIKRARSDGSYHPLLAESEHLDHAISQRR